MEDGDKFIRTVRVTGIVCALLLGLIAWTAEKSLARLDKLADKVDEIGRVVAVQQAIMLMHSNDIERLKNGAGNH